MYKTMKAILTSVGKCFTGVGLVLAEHPIVASLIAAYFSYHYLKQFKNRQRENRGGVRGVNC